MKERNINIWGNLGCRLPNGGLCHACCVLPNIELEGTYVSVVKPENSPCPHLGGAGCDLHNGNKPESCRVWHCSQGGLNEKLDLLAEGLALGFVTREEASDLAADVIKRSSQISGDLSKLINERVIRKSENLARLTSQKGIYIRDLVET